MNIQQQDIIVADLVDLLIPPRVVSHYLGSHISRNESMLIYRFVKTNAVPY